MKHLKKLLGSIHIHSLTYICFLFSLVCGVEQSFLLSLGVVCTHELCHLLMAYYFHFEIDGVEILPFGAYLSLKDFYNHEIVEEICVVLAGPCSHLVIYFILELLPVSDLSMYLKMMNALIFYFNLVPIYPMDGHRLICLLLQLCMDLKKAFEVSLKISVFSLVILSVFYFGYETCMIISFLFYQQFQYYRNISNDLREFYSRIPTIPKYKKVAFHKKWEFKRGYENYYFVNYHFVHQSQVYFELLKRVKQRK